MINAQPSFDLSGRVAATIRLLLLCSAWLVLPPRECAAQQHPIFPLTPGATWRYAGHADWTVANTTNPGILRSGQLQWKAEVVKVFSAPGVTAAVVEGFPFELAWYDPDKQPAFVVVIENAQGLYVTSDAADESDAEVLASKATHAPIESEQVMKFPLRVGDCLGDGTAAELLAAHMYCWLVKDEVQDPGGKAWDLIYDSGPDDMSFRIVAGVGITRFHYRHHGTVANTEASLTGFHPPKAR
jgi:hypothetical protein